MKSKKLMKRVLMLVTILTLVAANVLSTGATNAPEQVKADATLGVAFVTVCGETVGTAVVKEEGVVGASHTFKIGEEIQLPEGYHVAESVLQPTTFIVCYGTQLGCIIVVEKECTQLPDCPGGNLPGCPGKPECPGKPGCPDITWPPTWPEWPEWPEWPPCPEKPNPPVDPENPDPENPDPENPDPENPDPENPDPENPDPEKPDPEKPDPEKPDPEKPGTTDPQSPATPDNGNQAKAPKTGDSSNVTTLVIALGVSVIAIISVVSKKRRTM